MAGRYDITIKQGDTYESKPIIWEVGGEPVDITNKTPKCQMRTEPNSGVIAEIEVVKINSLAGAFGFKMAKVVSATIPTNGKTPFESTDYVYDLEWTDTDTITNTLLDGLVHVLPGVTK